MEPGAGAAEQARRHAARAEHLAAQYAQDASEDARAALERAHRAAQRWSAGAHGEVQVAGALAGLDRYGWTALHDVRWPGRAQANLDHVALGPGGVVVVDAKNWTGQVGVRDGTLRQNGYQRTREVESALAAAAAVTALLNPTHRTAVRTVLCLADRDVPATTTTSGVIVVGQAHLAEYLTALPPRLSPYDVADIGRHLHGQLERPASSPARPRRRRAPRAPAPPRTSTWQRTRAGRRRPRLGARVATTLAILLGMWWVLQLAAGVLTGYLDDLSTPPDLTPTTGVVQPTPTTTAATTADPG